MNTSKQINVMIILMFLLLIVLGVYALFDPIREQQAAATQTDLLGQRGAALYVANCRPCHGDVGQGRIGPALNRPDLRDPAKLAQNQAFVMDTIECGRVGTLMPTWGQQFGGPLDDEQVRDLVTLITINPNDAWNRYVRPLSEAANQVATPAAVADLLKGSITGSTDSVCGQKVASGTSGPPPATPSTPSSSLTETTTDNKFSNTDYTVPANAAVAIAVSNQGNAVHNWHVTDAKDANGNDITTGDSGILSGQSVNLTFNITQPGTYHFQCDFHPTEMLGTLFVANASGVVPSSPAGGSSATPAAGATSTATPSGSTTPGAGAPATPGASTTAAAGPSTIAVTPGVSGSAAGPSAIPGTPAVSATAPAGASATPVRTP
jgi:mono/diheme cytochrome c family protein/plastocyanin